MAEVEKVSLESLAERVEALELVSAHVLLLMAHLAKGGVEEGFKQLRINVTAKPDLGARKARVLQRVNHLTDLAMEMHQNRAEPPA